MPGRSSGAPAAWPILRPEALYGLCGQVVDAIIPETEADSASLLFNFMGMFGAYVGSGPRMSADGAVHTPRLFIVTVGRSSRARKTTGQNQIKRVFADVDPDWQNRIKSGFASGEALIEELAAEAHDPRLLISEPEFATVLTRAGREGSILSAIMRDAWDGNRLENRRAGRGQHTSVARNHYLTVSAQITTEELLRRLSVTEQANGFANRFLFVAVDRSKRLPDGGHIEDTTYRRLAGDIRNAANSARRIGWMSRLPEAAEAWSHIYNSISDDVTGMHASLTARAEAQMLRMQMLFAAAEGTDKISVEHVAAAKACWDYCEQSVRWIFGDSFGDQVADKLYPAFVQAGPDGLTRTQQSDLLGRNVTAARLGDARQRIHERYLIVTTKQVGNGPPTVIDRLGYLGDETSESTNRERDNGSQLVPSSDSFGPPRGKLGLRGTR